MLKVSPPVNCRALRPSISRNPSLRPAKPETGIQTTKNEYSPPERTQLAREPGERNAAPFTGQGAVLRVQTHRGCYGAASAISQQQFVNRKLSFNLFVAVDSQASVGHLVSTVTGIKWNSLFSAG